MKLTATIGTGDVASIHPARSRQRWVKGRQVLAAGLLLLLVLGLVPAVPAAAADPTPTPAVTPPPTAASKCLPGQITGGCSLGKADASRAAEAELAAKFSPIMEMKKQTKPCDDKGEPYLPAPVEVTLGDPRVVLRENKGGATAAKDPIVKRGPTAADLANKGPSYYLDMPGDPLEPGCTYEKFSKERMEGRQPVIYAHVVTDPDGGGVIVQYWFYYVFNRFNNLHESDWEGIQLYFAADSPAQALEQDEPDEMAFAQHEGGELGYWGDAKVSSDGTHPVIYPASGSHATYYSNDTYLGWGERGSGLGCDDSSGPSFRVVPEVVLLPDKPAPTGPFAWLTFQGRWGQKERFVFNGPTGPNTKDRWSDPFTWESGLRHSSLPIGDPKSFGPDPAGFFCGGVSFFSGLFVESENYQWYTYGAIALLILIPLIVLFLMRHLLGGAIKVFIRHAATFLALGAGLIVLGAVGSYIDDGIHAIPYAGDVIDTLFDLVTPTQGFFFSSSSGVPSFIGFVVVIPAVVFAVGEIEAGRQPHVRDSLRVALQRIWTTIRASLRAAIIVILLIISIVGIPWALVKVVRWAMIIEAVILDKTTWRQAARTSEKSVIGRWWRTLIVFAASALIIDALAPIVGILVLIFIHSSIFVANAVSGAIYALMFPLAGIIGALWFLRRQGPWDIEPNRGKAVVAPVSED